METIEARTSKDLRTRILMIDVLRGLVMVIMAIDHTREFWGPNVFRAEDVTQTTVPLFFTRWITHLCAPTFVFLSGMSVYLYQQQKQNIKATGKFLVTRGLWLIVVEIAVMGLILTHGYNLIVLSVFWVIGASMILMALVIRLPRVVILSLSLIMIAGHNLLPIIQPVTVENFPLAILHNSPFFLPTNPSLLVPYTIVPWLAVMMLGYCMAGWFNLPERQRDSRFLWTGIMMLIVFVALRLSNVYGDPVPWSAQERGGIYTVLSFINVNKYPASLLFLCVTLGISLLLMRTLGKRSGAINNILVTYGRVPFFFFILHFAVISLTSAIWTKLAFGVTVNLAFSSPTEFPAGYEFSLGRVYIVWMVVLVVTYFPCKWFGDYRLKNKQWWLSYL
jgi:uncharacterized membrane protein